MIPYFIYFFIPVLIYVTTTFYRNNESLNKFFLYFFFIISVVFVGTRYEVGGDWTTYIRNLKINISDSLFKTLEYDPTNIGGFSIEPGWALLSWLVKTNNLGIIGLNFISSLLFFIGLYLLCSKSNNFWISIIIAVPYMIIIVSMGYVRQSIALSFLMISISLIYNDEMRFKKLFFLIFLIIGASFHRSLYIMFPLIFIIDKKLFSLKNIFYFFILLFFLFFYFNDVFFNSMYINYVKNKMITGMHSTGAVPRILLNFIPSFLFLYNYKKFKNDKDFKFLLYLSLISIISILFIKVGTTALDRMSIYLMPLQILLWPKLISIFTNHLLKIILVKSLIFTYFMVLFVWMNFGDTRRGWVPYSSVLFVTDPVLNDSIIGFNE